MGVLTKVLNGVVVALAITAVIQAGKLDKKREQIVGRGDAMAKTVNASTTDLAKEFGTATKGVSTKSLDKTKTVKAIKKVLANVTKQAAEVIVKKKELDANIASLKETVVQKNSEITGLNAEVATQKQTGRQSSKHRSGKTYSENRFTKGQNLFIAVNPEETIQITHDKEDGLSNGNNYVHRNEFGIRKGTFWSPKGNYLAYYHLDQRMVTQYPLVDLDSRPAKLRYIRYPFTGMTSELKGSTSRSRERPPGREVLAEGARY